MPETAPDGSTPAPRLSVAELADTFHALMERVENPATANEERGDIVEMCSDLLRWASSIPAADNAELALKVEMIARCRRSGGFAEDELLNSALADAVRLIGRSGRPVAQAPASERDKLHDALAVKLQEQGKGMGWLLGVLAKYGTQSADDLTDDQLREVLAMP